MMSERASAARAIALGAFDGLHTAHRTVLARAESLVEAEGLVPSVLLFDSHPQQFLRGCAPPQLLTDGDRDEMLRSMGLEILTVPFQDVMSYEPRRFFSEILLGHFGARALCCGYHYRFGRQGAGDPSLLLRLCAERGIRLEVVPMVKYGNAPVSSTRIRACLAQGNLDDANAMLGRPFGYAFAVENGARIGHALGVPTLNQRFPPGFAVPKYGVYASQAFAEGKWRPSVTNIGVRPSFGGHEPRSETHIVGFSGVLYGRKVPVRLLRYVREERRFGTAEELSRQIRKDIRDAGT
jgi:riboflavin kinase/FMN adenylyltransferase